MSSYERPDEPPAHLEYSYVHRRKKRKKLGIKLKLSPPKWPPEPCTPNTGTLGEMCRFIASNFQYHSVMMRAVCRTEYYDDPAQHGGDQSKGAFELESALDQKSLLSGTAVMMSDPIMRACQYIGVIGHQCNTFAEFEELVHEHTRIIMIEDTVSRMAAQQTTAVDDFCDTFAVHDSLYKKAKQLIALRGIFARVNELRQAAVNEPCWSSNVVRAACDLFLAAWGEHGPNKEAMLAAFDTGRKVFEELTAD